jgi:hypothetical protein
MDGLIDAPDVNLFLAFARCQLLGSQSSPSTAPKLFRIIFGIRGVAAEVPLRS